MIMVNPHRSFGGFDIVSTDVDSTTRGIFESSALPVIADIVLIRGGNHRDVGEMWVALIVV
jgi:hypothetical protein